MPDCEAPWPLGSDHLDETRGSMVSTSRLMAEIGRARVCPGVRLTVGVTDQMAGAFRAVEASSHWTGVSLASQPCRRHWLLDGSGRVGSS